MFSVSVALNGISAQNLLQGRQQNASDMEFADCPEAVPVKDKSYGTVSLGADFEQGNLRKAQDAQTKYGILFNADILMEFLSTLG